MYATWPGRVDTRSPVPGSAAIDARTAGSSNRTTRAAPTGNRPSPSTTPAPLSATNSTNRCAGYPGSNGRYAAPAFHTASSATARSRPRSRQTPTTDSTPTPNPTRCRASWFARTSSSAYVSDTSPHTTATTSGTATARPAINSSTPPVHGTDTAVSFHDRNANQSSSVN